MIKFFGKIDMNKAGRISSEIPAWSMKTHIDDLREEIQRKERAIARGDMPLDGIPYAQAKIKEESERLQEILNSRPKLTDKEVDSVDKCRKSLGSKISRTMFTRSDMKLGLADAQEEARRMKGMKTIKLDKEEVAFCEANEIKVNRDGWTSRDNASKCFKLLSRYLGESGNVEQLRKDKLTVRTGRVA